jgi:chemotaxis protein MotA
MFVIVGLIVVTLSVVVGFLVAGGNLMLLLQWAEFIVIGGTAVGSILIASSPSLVKKIIAELPNLFKGHHSSKQDYLELLKSFNDLFNISQKEGMLAIEKHIETPTESEVLSKNKKFIEDEMVRDFFCDTLKVMLTGGIPPHELEQLIDTEIETFEMESKPVYHTIARVGDALPGIGIVAAVLGIIVTMSSIDQGAEVVGKLIAAALVGTFLGVLLAYGFVNPLANNLEHTFESKARLLTTIKTCIISYARGNPPIIAVEMARRTIFSEDRPTFSELEKFVRGRT